MDYYEELGVDRSAPASEIRLAYKRLVRLLHPDHCEDEPLRRQAELQMKRLNGILAVLTDPAGRARYDRGLIPAADRGEVPRLLSRRWPPSTWPALGAAVSVALIFAWFHSPRPAPVGMAPREEFAASAQAAAKAPVRPPRSHRTREIIAEEQQPEDGPVIGPPPEAAQPVPRGSQIPAAADDAPVLQSVALPAAAFPPAEPARVPPRSTLAGEWLFVPQPHATNQGLYPPEYIELRVTESAGVVRGRYRARYRVADQAISPDVTFQFQGPAEPTGASLPWSGAGGSQGDVTLRLLTSGALEVTWMANQMGSELGLISGTATLIRKLE